MTSENTTGLSRRTLAKGAAWAVPAVGIAAAAPAMAASGGGPTLVLGAACKNPGNSCKSRPKGYTVAAQICNDTPLDIWIFNVTYTTSGTDLNLTYAPPPALPFKVPKNDCINIFLNASSGNSANQAFTLYTTLHWSHNQNPADDPMQDKHTPVTDDVVIPGTPPDCICPD
nr:hypothetical protein [Propionibacterium sp.]